jgi:hypothetical protein
MRKIKETKRREDKLPELNLGSRMEDESYVSYRQRLRDNKHKIKKYLNPNGANVQRSYHFDRFDNMFVRNKIFSHLQVTSFQDGTPKFIKHYM